MAKTEKFIIANNYFEKQEVEGTIKTFDECPNEKWGYRKVREGLWNVTHIRSGLEAVQGKTQAECTKSLKNILSNPKVVEFIHKTPDIDTAIAQRKAKEQEKYAKVKKFNKLSDNFYKLTGIRVPRDTITCGLDIIKLDEMLHVPDNISMADYLTQKYGKKASDIINKMVNL